MGNPIKPVPTNKQPISRTKSSTYHAPESHSFHDVTKKHIEQYHPIEHDVFMAANPSRPTHGRQDDYTSYYNSDDMNDELEIHSIE